MLLTNINQSLDHCAQSYQIYDTVLNGYVMLAVCICGLMGNFLSISHLVHRYLQSSTFRYYLYALCVSGSVVLVTSLMMNSMPRVLGSTLLQSSYAAHVVIVTAYPVGHVAQTAVTWLTTAVTIVQFLAVRHPWSIQRSNGKQLAAKVILIVLGASVLFNIPRALELKVTECFIQGDEGNSTGFDLFYGGLRFEDAYQLLYLSIAHNVCIVILPFAVQSSLVLSITVGMRKSSMARRELLSTGVKLTQMTKDRLMIKRIFLFISIFFLVCHLPMFASNVVEIALQPFLSEQQLGSQMFFNLLVSIGNLLICINAGFNFVFYACFSRNFRQNVQKSVRTLTHTVNHSTAASHMHASRSTPLINDSVHSLLIATTNTVNTVNRVNSCQVVVETTNNVQGGVACRKLARIDETELNEFRQRCASQPLL